MEGESHYPIGGNLDICPHLDCLELPCHSPTELTSISSLKIWGEVWDPSHDMAYLLICLGNTTEGRQYRVSLMQVNPKQARISTMEEVVENWPPTPPVEMTGPTSWLSSMRVPAMHHSPRANTWASCLKERQRKPPAGEQSAQCLPTPFHQPPSGLPLRFEWMQ